MHILQLENLMVIPTISHELYDSRAPCLKFGSFDMKILISISFLTMKMELFPKNVNEDHWRTLQAICACSQICNWSTVYMVSSLDGRQCRNILIT